MGIENIRMELNALRKANGRTSAIGYRCWNIGELIKIKNPPPELLKRQMRDLKRLLRVGQ